MNFEVFHQNLSALLESRGMYMAELASAIDTTPATLSRYYQGKRSPDIKVLIGIADFFGVSLDWLVGRSDVKNKISEDVVEFVRSYSVASEDDRRVVQIILQKYRKG